MYALYKFIHTRSHDGDTQSHSMLCVIWYFLICAQIAHIYMFLCTNENQVVMFTMVPKKKICYRFSTALLPPLQPTVTILFERGNTTLWFFSWLKTQQCFFLRSCHFLFTTNMITFVRSVHFQNGVQHKHTYEVETWQ